MSGIPKKRKNLLLLHLPPISGYHETCHVSVQPVNCVRDMRERKKNYNVGREPSAGSRVRALGEREGKKKSLVACWSPPSAGQGEKREEREKKKEQRSALLRTRRRPEERGEGGKWPSNARLSRAAGGEEKKKRADLFRLPLSPLAVRRGGGRIFLSLKPYLRLGVVGKERGGREPLLFFSQIAEERRVFTILIIDFGVEGKNSRSSSVWATR